MAAAFKAVRADMIPFGDSEFSYSERYARGYDPDQSAAGDLAALHLTRGEFVNALEVFLQGKLWEDAAFVGDRVLTVDELKKYVDAHYAESVAAWYGHKARVRFLPWEEWRKCASGDPMTGGLPRRCAAMPCAR